MSRNLYKSNWVVVQNDEKCVIDSNTLLAGRIEELEALRRHRAAAPIGEVDEDGFTSGLEGERIDALLYDNAEGGNVMKAAEEDLDVPDLDEIRAQAEAEIAAAKAEVEQIKQLAREEIEAQKQEVLEEARKNGYDEGMRRAQAQADKMRQELDAERSRLEKEYNELVDQLEPQFIDTITAIFNHIFHVELQNDRNILVHLIETTLRKVESSRTFIVHVSKEDYPYVSMQKKALNENGINSKGIVEIVEDVTLRKSECMIETDGGIFDCGLDTQLEGLTNKLKVLSFEKCE
ncbi:MAG: FliH/SctL family protein [Lachnospiraceae bacterium]|nr:FliH/SctL family protein [Lachnospiraceae bacterium]